MLDEVPQPSIGRYLWARSSLSLRPANGAHAGHSSHTGTGQRAEWIVYVRTITELLQLRLTHAVSSPGSVLRGEIVALFGCLSGLTHVHSNRHYLLFFFFFLMIRPPPRSPLFPSPPLFR